ncbi:hypothetical protein ACOSQ3_022632 [Xanthoceras sorbifolium]
MYSMMLLSNVNAFYPPDSDYLGDSSLEKQKESESVEKSRDINGDLEGGAHSDLWYEGEYRGARECWGEYEGKDSVKDCCYGTQTSEVEGTIMQGVEMESLEETIGPGLGLSVVQECFLSKEGEHGSVLVDQNSSDGPKNNVRKWKQAARGGPSTRGSVSGGHWPIQKMIAASLKIRKGRTNCSMSPPTLMVSNKDKRPLSPAVVLDGGGKRKAVETTLNFVQGKRQKDPFGIDSPSSASVRN